MKNLSTRVFAALLMVWYCLSIVGFGVHTCSESNRCFLTNFISGVSCDDIHEHKCHCCDGHSHDSQIDIISSQGVRIVQGDCCSDDYQQIEITGSGQCHGMEKFDADCSLIAVISAVPMSDPISYSQNSNSRHLPDRAFHIGEVCPLYSVWRI